ncbi:MAG: AmmeMemoRadiSam system protein B [Candidatus Diapherotrites archaeon]
MAQATREAAVAGQFYPRDRELLKKQISDFISKAKKSGQKEKSSAVIAPHAGLIYSGQTAAYSFNALQAAETFLIVSPNHTGVGERISVFPAGKWEMPLGEIEIDWKLSEKICLELGIEPDESAHIGEHSIEVQLPFLQFVYGNKFRLVAITIAENRLRELKKLGEAIANACKGESVSLIASSDFSHFIPLKAAKKRDSEAIGFIERIDLDGFHKTVLEKYYSICGFAPITALMHCCKINGFKGAELLRYDSSATESGDEGSVVGYAAIKFLK